MTKRDSRFNLTMTQAVRKRLGAIAESKGVTMTEISQRSLAIYEHVWKAENRGATVIIKEADGTERELLIL